MPVRQKIIPFSPNSNGGNDNSTKNVMDGFTLKPIGSGNKRNTLVESDSISSYSLPDETIRPNAKIQQSEKKAATGANRDASAEKAQVAERNRSGDPNPLHKEGNRFMSIDIGKDNAPNQELTYIRAYMKFMYWTCICPFDPMKNENADKEECLFNKILGVLQKMCFAVIMFLSIFLSILVAKTFLLYNFYNGNLETFIEMVYFMFIVASKIYYVYVFVRQQQKFVRMFKSMENLTENKIYVSSPILYTIVLGTISLSLGISQIIWSVGIMEWTPEKTLQFHFEDSARKLFVWSMKEYENGTAVETILEENANGITNTKLYLGGLQMAMIFCSNLHNDALANMMLTNAETIKREMGILEVKISEPKNDIENVSLSEFLTENGDWAYFKLLKQAINDHNDAFDSLLKYKHANNLMLFVYFALNVCDGELSLVSVIRLLYNMIRASYTYRIASQASSLNQAEEKWIRRLGWKTKDQEFLDKVQLILHELGNEPLGMGKGQFLIDESFIYRFLGSVGSVFVLQAQSREGKAD